MALTDTSEYWNDIKRNNSYTGRDFYHIPNANCGHKHKYEAKKLGDVNCFECLKLIADGYVHGLEDGVTDNRSKGQKKIDRVRERVILEQQKIGKCSCGCARVKRYNKNNGKYFLGCSNYPKCTLTSSVE